MPDRCLAAACLRAGPDVDVGLRGALHLHLQVAVPEGVHGGGRDEPEVGFHADVGCRGRHVAEVALEVLSGDVVAAPHGHRSTADGLHGPGLVVHVADLEDRRAVAGDQDGSAGLQAGEHALLPIGNDVAGPVDHREVDDGGREAVVIPGLGQYVLAEELVAAVLDLGVAALRGVVLGDGQVVRCRVDHRRACEHVLAGPPVEELNHEPYVVGVVGAHVQHHVELEAAQDLAHLVVVGPVGEEAVDAVRQRRLGPAPVHDGHVVSAAGQLVDQRQAVELRAAHHQHSQGVAPHVETPRAVSARSTVGDMLT